MAAVGIGRCLSVGLRHRAAGDGGRDRGVAISSVVDVGVNFLVLKALLRRERLVASTGAFGSYFAAMVLADIGIVAGVLLLVVPGLYLASRWLIALALVICQGCRAVEALGESWTLTRGNAGPLMAANVLCIGPPLALGVLVAMSVPTMPGLPSGPSIETAIDLACNALFAATSAAGSCLVAGATRLLISPKRQVEDVFA